MDNRLVRTQMLLGEEAMEKLKNSTVAVFGIGGVGGYAAEAIARCGVGKIVLIDNDTVGFWKSKWGAGCFYFPWHCMWAAWLLNPEASVVCAAPSFCGSPSGGSGKNQPASRYQALSLLLRWNPVRIKLHDEK